MIKLMYITKSPEVALIAEEAGVDRIFVDMEFINKDLRQHGLDTVQNHHSVEDIKNIRTVINHAELLVRVNPIHEELSVALGDTYNYPSSKDEIESVLNAGADIIMLPFFKTLNEVQYFISCVAGRAKTCLLVETPEAADLLAEIVEVSGIDMIYLGLNDMHLALKKQFMFQLLADGSVDRWAKIISNKGIAFGFGGLASLDGGIIPGRMILKEHYRLGSSMVIVSRAFCNTDKIKDLSKIRTLFNDGISQIRKLETEIAAESDLYFMKNHAQVVDAVNKYVESL